MYYRRKTDPILLFDGGEDELENKWSFISDSGLQILISLNSFIDHPLHSLEQHLWEDSDFPELIEAMNVQKSAGISGNYCNEQGIELFWLEEPFDRSQPLVIVSFGEVNAGRYRVVVEGEIDLFKTGS
ncbi:MAG: hypothetical protein V4604_00035 [Bacteroidota bacterium]